MTAYTPTYALPYLEVGQPVRDTRAVLQALTFAVEAALADGAITPPGGADWAALSADTGWLPFDPFLTANWTAPGLGARYRKRAKTVDIQLEATRSVAWAANTQVLQLPLGFRPGRAWWIDAPGYGNTRCQVYISAGGVITLPNSGTAGSGFFLTTSFPVD